MKETPWANKELSLKLLKLTKKGEGQDLEFIRDFPEQTHEVAKEIAAFSTSNDGLILIGVADSGKIIGIDGDTAKKRDNYQKRIEGICKGAVKPSVTPTVKFIIYEKKIVLGIEIQKGSEPIYYSNSRPYIRHHSSSRPAEPHEVINLILKHFEKTELDEEENLGEKIYFYSFFWAVAHVLIHVQEIEGHKNRQSFNRVKSSLGFYSSNFFEAACQDYFKEFGFFDDLTKLGNLLSEVLTFEFLIGNEPWEEFQKMISEIFELTETIRKGLLDIRKPTEEQVVEKLRNISNSCEHFNQQIALRAEKLIGVKNNFEFFYGASKIGEEILYNIYEIKGFERRENKNRIEALEVLSFRIRLLESKSDNFPDGSSKEELLLEINEINKQLSEIGKKITPSSE